jgi:hypothetical protein
MNKFFKIDESKVHNIWTCNECNSKETVTPDWYQNNGTPMCCDEDMEYSHTEVSIDTAPSTIEKSILDGQMVDETGNVIS